MDKRLIAVVDDEPDVLKMISEYFTGRGFRVRTFHRSKDLMNFLNDEIPDLIILDLMFPDDDGFTICKRLKERKSYSAIPVIFLSAKIDEDDKVQGLGLGAEDYVIKPFSLKELHARIDVILKRQLPQKKDAEIHVRGIMKVSPSRYEVTVLGKRIELTLTEFKVLECLCGRKGQVFTRESILDHVWAGEKRVTEQTVDVHIKHLREKLGKAGELIKSVRGIGYRIE